MIAYLRFSEILIQSARLVNIYIQTICNSCTQSTLVNLTLWWRRPLLYWNRSIDSQSKSMDWANQIKSVCLTILGYYALKGWWIAQFYFEAKTEAEMKAYSVSQWTIALLHSRTTIQLWNRAFSKNMMNKPKIVWPDVSNVFSLDPGTDYNLQFCS